MRPIVLTKTLTAAVANNIALSQTPVSGTDLTLNGTLVASGVATLDTPRRVLLTFGNEGSARTAVVYGTMEGGATISETLAVPSGGASTVATLQDFATVTRITPAGGGWTAAVTVGTNGVGSTRWIVPNYQQQVQNIGVEYEVLSGAVTSSIETTQNDPRPPISIYANGQGNVPPVPTPIGASGLTGMATATQGGITITCMGVRLTVTAGAGSARATLVPAGLRD